MKILLAFLMCLVLCTSECFALSGGPVFGNNNVSTTGIYAGLLLPVSDPNSLGIFSVTIPKTGIGTGNVAVFRNGNYYPGSFQGLADPDSAKLTGVIQASFSRTVGQVVTNGSTTSTITFVYTYQVNGSVKGQIRNNTNRLSAAAARITGESDLTYTNDEGNPSGSSNGQAIKYTINGFKQQSL